MFFNKKVTSDEYDTLVKRIITLNHDMETLKALFKGLELENKDLRDKVLRKIQFKRAPEGEEVTQDLNSKPGFVLS